MNRRTKPLPCRVRMRLLIAGTLIGGFATQAAGQTEIIDQVLPRVAKVFGTGGMSRLESWQTAIAVSPDGMFLTAWSYVLDSGATIVLGDGRRFEARLVGYHPRRELALLKIDVDGQPCFDVNQRTSVQPGIPILAVSNLYGIATGNEQVSVQRGIVSAVTVVTTRRGPRSGGYQGPAIIVDVISSNPGAAGGAITDERGQLLGMIGRESRDAASDLWLNYAIPLEQIRDAMDEIITGQVNTAAATTGDPAQPVTPELLGLVLVPNVVANTPGWIEQVIPNGPASRAGLQADDLIVEIDGVPAATRRRILERLSRIERDQRFSITVQREGEFLDLEIVVNQ